MRSDIDRPVASIFALVVGKSEHRDQTVQDDRCLHYILVEQAAGVYIKLESLILAQNERWRRA